MWKFVYIYHSRHTHRIYLMAVLLHFARLFARSNFSTVWQLNRPQSATRHMRNVSKHKTPESLSSFEPHPSTALWFRSIIKFNIFYFNLNPYPTICWKMLCISFNVQYHPFLTANPLVGYSSASNHIPIGILLFLFMKSGVNYHLLTS